MQSCLVFPDMCRLGESQRKSPANFLQSHGINPRLAKQSKSCVAWILHTFPTFPTLQALTERTHNRFKMDCADKQKTYAGENWPQQKVLFHQNALNTKN